MQELRVQFLTIDRHDPKIMEALSRAPIFKEKGEVRAIIALGGELIETKLADGTVETKNTAAVGEVIVTNPGGEQYITSAEIFNKRHEPKPGEKGVYSAKGYCRATPNPWDAPITMMASWGKMQNGKADCMIADIYDVATKAMGGEPYIIDSDSFSDTYEIIK